jgi:hypothetical protein
LLDLLIKIAFIYFSIHCQIHSFRFVTLRKAVPGQGMVVHDYNTSTQEVEARGLQVLGSKTLSQKYRNKKSPYVNKQNKTNQPSQVKPNKTKSFLIISIYLFCSHFCAVS